MAELHAMTDTAPVDAVKAEPPPPPTPAAAAPAPVPVATAAVVGVKSAKKRSSVTPVSTIPAYGKLIGPNGFVRYLTKRTVTIGRTIAVPQPPTAAAAAATTTPALAAAAVTPTATAAAGASATPTNGVKLEFGAVTNGDAAGLTPNAAAAAVSASASPAASSADIMIGVDKSISRIHARLQFSASAAATAAGATGTTTTSASGSGSGGVTGGSGWSFHIAGSGGAFINGRFVSPANCTAPIPLPKRALIQIGTQLMYLVVPSAMGRLSVPIPVTAPHTGVPPGTVATSNPSAEDDAAVAAAMADDGADDATTATASAPQTIKLSASGRALKRPDKLGDGAADNTTTAASTPPKIKKRAKAAADGDGAATDENDSSPLKPPKAQPTEDGGDAMDGDADGSGLAAAAVAASAVPRVTHAISVGPSKWKRPEREKLRAVIVSFGYGRWDKLKAAVPDKDYLQLESFSAQFASLVAQHSGLVDDVNVVIRFAIAKGVTRVPFDSCMQDWSSINKNAKMWGGRIVALYQLKVAVDARGEDKALDGCPALRGRLPAEWWTRAHDIDLVRGLWRHGYGAFTEMRDDPNLSFAALLKPVYGPPPTPTAGAGAAADGDTKTESDGAAPRADGLVNRNTRAWPPILALIGRFKRIVEALRVRDGFDTGNTELPGEYAAMKLPAADAAAANTGDAKSAAGGGDASATDAAAAPAPKRKRKPKTEDGDTAAAATGGDAKEGGDSRPAKKKKTGTDAAGKSDSKTKSESKKKSGGGGGANAGVVKELTPVPPAHARHATVTGSVTFKTSAALATALGVWTTEEKEQFLGGLMSFGHPPTWNMIRDHYPRLASKSDRQLQTHFDIVNYQLNPPSATAAAAPAPVVWPELWAGNTSACELDATLSVTIRERINFIARLRVEVLGHSEFDSRIALSPWSPDLPACWEIGRHDRGLLIGIHTHGLGSWAFIFQDPALGFGSAAPAFDSTTLLANQHSLILTRLNEVLSLFQAGVDLLTVSQRFSASLIRKQQHMQQLQQQQQQQQMAAAAVAAAAPTAIAPPQ